VDDVMSECWRVTVDREACLGSGVCAGTAPEYFRLEDGRSRPIREFVEPDEDVLDAADLCPAEAITVHDAAGHRLAPDTT
jgi:ferredoxin